MPPYMNTDALLQDFQCKFDYTTLTEPVTVNELQESSNELTL